MYEDQKWFKCLSCGYQWQLSDIDLTYLIWYDEYVVAKCCDCRDAKDKLNRIDINKGFKPC